MKNLFVKENNTTLIVSVVAGALVAGALVYLYFTEEGEQSREKLKHQVKEGIKDKASGYVSKKTKISKKAIKAVADHLSK